MNEHAISFCVSGYVTQRIHIEPDVKLTLRQIIKMLNDGSAVTTIQEQDEDGNHFYIEETSTGTPLAMIVDIDNNLEYEHFDEPFENWMTMVKSI
jgi:hypothetical protein